MKIVSNNESYSPTNLVVVTAASCLASLLVILLFFWFVNSVSYHHPSMLPSQTDFLFASLWCVVANFAAALFLLPFSNSLKQFLPSWLLVPVIGNFLFVLSFWLVEYWNSIQSYSDSDPFAIKPPDMQDVLFSVILVGILMAIPSMVISFNAVRLYSTRRKGNGLNLK